MFHLFLSPISTVSTTGVAFWNYLHLLYLEDKDFLKWLETAYIIENMGNSRDIFQLIIRHKSKIIPVYIMKDRGNFQHIAVSTVTCFEVLHHSVPNPLPSIIKIFRAFLVAIK